MGQDNDTAICSAVARPREPGEHGQTVASVAYIKNVLIGMSIAPRTWGACGPLPLRVMRIHVMCTKIK